MVLSLALSLALMANTTSMNGYLERAIERGVPLYNSGQPAACAAVYATALEGVGRVHRLAWSEAGVSGRLQLPKQKLVPRYAIKLLDKLITARLSFFQKST